MCQLNMIPLNLTVVGKEAHSSQQGNYSVVKKQPFLKSLKQSIERMLTGL